MSTYINDRIKITEILLITQLERRSTIFKNENLIKLLISVDNENNHLICHVTSKYLHNTCMIHH